MQVLRGTRTGMTQSGHLQEMEGLERVADEESPRDLGAETQRGILRTHRKEEKQRPRTGGEAAEGSEERRPKWQSHNVIVFSSI